jgi:hypothetical protein
MWAVNRNRNVNRLCDRLLPPTTTKPNDFKDCEIGHWGFNNNGYNDEFFIFCINENFTTSSEVQTWLSANPIKIVFEIDREYPDIPTVDKVALNSLKTYEGVTYLEFDSPLEPEFVAEYGTSKVGGVALEARGESESIEEMNRILQGAFISRNSDEFGGDANLCLKSGVYYNGNWVNTKYSNGFLIVFACEKNVLIQINTSWSPEYIAARTCWHGTWWGWYKIATEVDIAALQTAIVNNI